MLFNMATPKAQAVAIVDDLAIGITALLLLAAAGVVFTPKDSDGIAAIGNSFKSSMYQWGTSAEKLDEVEEWFVDLSLYEPSDPGDEGDEDPRFEVRLARGILTGIALWIASVGLAGKIDIEGEAATDGYTYYGDVLLQTISSYDNYPYCLIVKNGSGQYIYYLTENPIYLDGSSDGYLYKVETTTAFNSALTSNGTDWSTSNSAKFYSTDTIAKIKYEKPVWSNYDLVADTGYVALTNCPPPSAFLIESLSPSAIVSDLPQQIQDGEKDADDIVLPGVIDYGSLIQDGMTLEESVIDTMTQLNEGTLSYDDYLSMTISAEQPTFIQNLPVTSTMSYAYEVGGQADTFTVEATGNSDGSGTLTYEWVDTSTVPYTVLGTGPSYTPDTSQVADYPLACRVTNTVPCSLSNTGYVTSDAYSWTVNISITDAITDAPGSDTGTDIEEDEELGIISGTLDRIESLLNPDTDSLTDSSQALQNSTDILNSFEQTQLDGLQNNKHVITDAFQIFGEGSTLLSAFNLVTYIVNGTYNSLGSYQVVITLPVVLGIFLFICSRVRGFDRPRKNNPGYRSSQAKASAAAGGNDPKSPEV